MSFEGALGERSSPTGQAEAAIELRQATRGRHSANSNRDVTYTDFKSQRYFPALQTLRTISVVLVIAAHMQDNWYWNRVHGVVGVTVFFVVSGFLITTLLIREQAAKGSASIGHFYIRRAFRILPLYLLVLAVFAVAILGLHKGGQVGDFRHSLPYYLTYQNDFGPEAPFGHTWSLAVEEKFYLLWPLIAVSGVALLRRWRATIAALALAAFLIVQIADLNDYLPIYVPILAGCLLALTMNDPRGFAYLRPLANPFVTVALVIAAAVVEVLTGDNGKIHTAFALLLTLAMPGLILAKGWLRSVLTIKLLVWAGARTYAAYLIHPLVKSSIDIPLPGGSASLARVLVRFVLTVVITFGVSDLLYRFFERPITEIGRRLARDRRPVGQLS